MEITLYDRQGRPQAYINVGDQNAIYLWSGHAVAYIDDEALYGWNGEHIGWYVDGVVFDLQGRRVGSIAAKCPYSCYAEPTKYAKYAQYAKYARYARYSRVAFYNSYSDEALDDFLKTGAVGSI